MTFKDKFFAFPVAKRAEIAQAAQLSLPYIHKHTYVCEGDPKFHFHNAVALDKASEGVLPFWEHTHGKVDWLHVLDRLRQAKRQGRLFPAKEAPSDA